MKEYSLTPDVRERSMEVEDHNWPLGGCPSNCILFYYLFLYLQGLSFSLIGEVWKRRRNDRDLEGKVKLVDDAKWIRVPETETVVSELEEIVCFCGRGKVMGMILQISVYTFRLWGYIILCIRVCACMCGRETCFLFLITLLFYFFVSFSFNKSSYVLWCMRDLI